MNLNDSTTFGQALASAEILDEISAVSVADTDIVGTVFIVPIEAALPHELDDIPHPDGSLYLRLAALDGLSPEHDFGLVLISGQELVDIAPSWTALVSVRKVAVLLDLPGVRYSTLFSLGQRQAGIPTASWPAVATGLGERARTRQRLVDSSPFLADVVPGTKAHSATKAHQKAESTSFDETDEVI